MPKKVDELERLMLYLRTASLEQVTHVHRMASVELKARNMGAPVAKPAKRTTASKPAAETATNST